MLWKSSIARALPLGIVKMVRAIRSGRGSRLHTRAVAELEVALRETLFPELPVAARRVQLLSQLIGTSATQAMFLIADLHRALEVDGDVCEFGVAQGATSALLAAELAGSDRHLWLFDSFEGLPKPTEKDVLLDDIFNLGEMSRYEGTMACSAREVAHRVATELPPARTHIVAARIEQARDLPVRICWAYVDFDFYEPTACALSIIHERLSAGGSVVIDDYGFFSAGAKTAVDEFLRIHDSLYALHRPPQFAGHFAMLRRVRG